MEFVKIFKKVKDVRKSVYFEQRRDMRAFDLWIVAPCCHKKYLYLGGIKL
jgi:hypothetical protein